MSWASPAPSRRAAWEQILRAHDSAAEAIEAGAYYAALCLAQQEGDQERFATALILCGWAERGLALLDALVIRDPRTHLYRAFGLWSLERPVEAIAALAAAPGEQAAGLRRIIERERIRILIIAGEHTRRGVLDDEGGPFDARALVLSEKDQAPPVAEILSDGFAPDLVLVLDVYGPRIPEGLYDLGVPVVFWAYDFDYYMPSQYDDLARAAVVSVGYAEEQHALARLHGGRVAQLLAHDVHTYSDRHGHPRGPQDFDVLHTGRSFTPLHRGKSRFLFALATHDDPSPRIRILDEFFSPRAYRNALSRARHVAIHERLIGGLQTRLVDALCAGAAPLLSDVASAEVFLTALGAPYRYAEDWMRAPDEPMRRAVRQELADNLRAIFPASPLRERRFIKFSLLQTLFSPANRRAPDTPQDGHTQVYRAAAAAFTRFLAQPLDAAPRGEVRALLEDGLARFTDSVPLRFLLARYLWTIGERDDAARHFRTLTGTAANGRFDPPREDVRFPILRSSAELTPYDDYVGAVVRELRDGKEHMPACRAVIAATAWCYVGLHELQSGRSEAGIAALESALAAFADHFAAARLLAKAYYAAGRPPAETAQAIRRAVAQYGPSLTELLPYALEVERAVHGEDAAVRLARAWCLFITRVSWRDPNEHPVPAESWTAVMPYLDRLPPGLAAAVTARRSA